MSRLTVQGGSVRPFLWRWAPPVLWMVLATLLSTDGFSTQQTSRYLLPFLHWLIPGASRATYALLHVGIRKGMHALEYGVLALLWYRAFKWGETGWRPQAAVQAFLLAAGFAAVDEARQAFEPHRRAAMADVGWDSLGALFGLGGCWVFRRVTGGNGKGDAPGNGSPGGAWLG